LSGKLTHIDPSGTARMVDVSDKPESARSATAEGMVRMRAETLAAVLAGDTGKGDVRGTARIAGIMAAKRTHDLIPLCHPLPLSDIALDIDADPTLPGVRIRATARVTGRTGVEMEALTAVSVACLTIYDMAKAVDREMTISEIRLVEKKGGRSGHWRRTDDSSPG
jgi:cyclic pyranopterin phosphate synthase